MILAKARHYVALNRVSQLDHDRMLGDKLRWGRTALDGLGCRKEQHRRLIGGGSYR
jgi:hypothetical protein